MGAERFGQAVLETVVENKIETRGFAPFLLE